MDSFSGLNLLLGIFFVFASASSASATERIYEENPLACPVVTLLPAGKYLETKQPDRMVYQSETGILIRRMEILVEPISKTAPRKTAQVSLTWTPVDVVAWGKQSRKLSVPLDGKAHCFFLGHHVEIPEGTPATEFMVSVSESFSIKHIAVSPIPSDRKMTTCPVSSVSREVEQLYQIAVRKPKDASATEKFVSDFAKLLPRYDCRRDFDYEPVPAWWLAESTKSAKWLEFVSKSSHPSAKKLFASEEFRSSLSGHDAEIYLRDSLRAGTKLKGAN